MAVLDILLDRVIVDFGFEVTDAQAQLGIVDLIFGDFAPRGQGIKHLTGPFVLNGERFVIFQGRLESLDADPFGGELSFQFFGLQRAGAGFGGLRTTAAFTHPGRCRRRGRPP